MSRVMSTHESFGEALREARTYRGLTQTQAAVAAGRSGGGGAATISGIENATIYTNGKRPRTAGVGIAWVAALARGLDVTFYITANGRWDWMPTEITEK